MPAYQIKQQFLPVPSKRRSGLKIDKVKFIVAHDTGNPGATAQANVDYYTKSANEMSASAHLFVDDTQIIECIPAFKNPEKAWHVWYSKTKDNELFGADANDAAIGIELCFGGKINAQEAYKRYVWLIAYLLKYHGLTPDKVVSHKILDPERRDDPDNALKTMGKTYDQLLADIKAEFNRIDQNGDYIKPQPTPQPTPPKPAPAPQPKPAPAPQPKPRVPVPDGILKLGDRGEKVKQLQVALNTAGFNCGKPDGIFGRMTYNGLISFQHAARIRVDGVYGEQTRQALIKWLSK